MSMHIGWLRCCVLLLLLLLMGTPLRSGEPGMLANGGSSGFVLPESGRTEAFSYSRSSQHAGMYEVRLGGQSSVPVYVADSTLNLLLSSPVPAGVQAAFVSQYPYQMLNMYEHVLNTYYPDDHEDYRDDPFPAWQGAGVTVEQDPLVPNYVRVSMLDENGNMVAFSISRRSMDEIFDLEMDAAVFADAVQDFPYRLPEQVRVNFQYLSREQIIDLIEQEPAMARQEFTQVKRIYLNSPDEIEVDTSIVQNPPLLTEEIPPEYGPDTIMPPPAPLLKPVRQLTRSASSDDDTAGAAPHEIVPDETTHPSRLMVFLVLVIAGVIGAGVVLLVRRR